MTNNDILQIAMGQSAIDANCAPEDFRKKKNILVPSAKNPKARKYLELPFVCNLISYGSNIVASIDKNYEDIVRAYIDKYPVEHCFETPNMHVLWHESMLYGGVFSAGRNGAHRRGEREP